MSGAWKDDGIAWFIPHYYFTFSLREMRVRLKLDLVIQDGHWGFIYHGGGWKSQPCE